MESRLGLLHLGLAHGQVGRTRAGLGQLQRRLGRGHVLPSLLHLSLQEAVVQAQQRLAGRHRFPLFRQHRQHLPAQLGDDGSLLGLQEA